MKTEKKEERITSDWDSLSRKEQQKLMDSFKRDGWSVVGVRKELVFSLERQVPDQPAAVSRQAMQADRPEDLNPFGDGYDDGLPIFEEAPPALIEDDPEDQLSLLEEGEERLQST